MTVILRDYQEQAVSDVRIALRDYMRSLLVLSTGAGKTVVFSFIAKTVASRGKRVLILAHRDQLIKQASSKLRDYDVEHGIIMAGFTPNPRANVQVGSVQTLVRRIEGYAKRGQAAYDKILADSIAAGLSEESAKQKAEAARKAATPQFDLIVVDEAHLSAAKSYIKILDFWPNAKVLGVTGSPVRLDNKPLGRMHGGVYDVMVKGISISQLIARGFLVKPVVYGAEQEIDLSGIKTSMGDYQTEALAELVDKPKITGDAVRHYQKICPGAPAVAWCVTIDHATHVAEAFNAQGIPAVMLCGEHDGPYRDKVLKMLASGEVKVVTFVGILVEGVDCPAISAIIMLRPTLSLASYLQVVGRGLRPYTHPDGTKKEVCYVLDHASMWKRHGFADEERDWSLDWGEKAKAKKRKKDDEVVDLKQCPKCYLVHEPSPICPKCGHVYEVKGRKLDHVDGELIEITPEMAEKLRKDKRKEVGKAQSLEELQKIEAERGYKPGWAKHVYESKMRRKAPPTPPPPPPVPSMEELVQMSLEQLIAVQNAQGWPTGWAEEFFNNKPVPEGEF